MALTARDLVLIKAIPVVHPTITWALCQRGGTNQTVVAQITALRGAPSGVAKNGVMVERTGGCQTDEALTQTSMMTLTEQRSSVKISIQISDLATAYVNLREGEAHHKKRNGGEVVQALLSHLTTGISMKQMAGARIEDLLDLGMAEDFQMSDSLMILRMHDIEEEEMKTLGELHPQDTKAVGPGEGTAFLHLMIL